MSILGTLKVLLSADTGKFSKDIKQGQSAVKSFKSDLMDLAKTAGVALSFGALAKGIKSTADTTAAYGKQVEDLSRSLGINTQEASKLIQITDDLEISQSALEMGMRSALRQGITPNIEGIKELAVQYQALNDPADKAAFALKTFGRNGLEMAKILEKTPEQIQEMAEALNNSALVMDEKSIKAAKDYRLSLDALEDSMMGLKVTVGNAVIPALTEAANKTAQVIDANIRLTNVEQSLQEAVKNGTISREKYNELIKGTATAAVFGSIELDGLAEAEEYLRLNVEGTSSAMQVGMGDLRAYEGGVKSLTTAAEENAAAQQALAYGIRDVSKAALGKEILDALNQSFREGTLSEREYAFEARNVMISMLDMSAQEALTSVSLSNLKAQLEAGKITSGEFVREVRSLNSSLNGLDGRVVDVTIRTTYQDVGSPSNPKLEGPRRRQHGGPVRAGEAYIVGEAGPELFVPSQGGQVISNRNIGSVNISVNAPSASGEELYRIIKRKLQEDLRTGRLRG